MRKGGLLARVAGDFYWLGRYLERTEQTARLLEYQLSGLADRPADEIALGWRVLYTTLDQEPPPAPADADEAEVFLVADAYTLAGALVEDPANEDSMISCWHLARENARRVRSQLPLRVWTRLNQGYLWLRESDFVAAWREAPVNLVTEVVDRLRLVSGVASTGWARDDAWRFFSLGVHVERLQQQTALLGVWEQVGRPNGGMVALPWTGLLEVSDALDHYTTERSRGVQRQAVLDFLARGPELTRSLWFATNRIRNLLGEIDVLGARHPLAPPHRMALHIAASLEGKVSRDSLQALKKDSEELNNLVTKQYVEYSIAAESVS